MSKISHLLEMIITLQYKGLTTASELAETLEVDKKTIYRYISSLNKANIPIHTKKGRYGGFYIDGDFYMKPCNLNEKELQALIMSSEILTKENGFIMERELQTAVTKVKSLCINEDKDLKALDNNGDFKVSYIGGLQNLDDKISKINHAVSRGRAVSLNYFSINKNSLTIRKVDVYNLIFKEGGWYIIGYCHMNECVKTFDLSRVKSIKITDEIYMIPHNFSLSEYLNNNWGIFDGDKIKVSIKFSKNYAEYIKNGRWHINQYIEDLHNGSVLLNMHVNETDELKKWVIGFGKDAEIMEPKELRKEIKDEIEQIYKKY